MFLVCCWICLVVFCFGCWLPSSSVVGVVAVVVVLCMIYFGFIMVAERQKDSIFLCLAFGRVPEEFPLFLKYLAGSTPGCPQGFSPACSEQFSLWLHCESACMEVLCRFHGVSLALGFHSPQFQSNLFPLTTP